MKELFLERVKMFYCEEVYTNVCKKLEFKDNVSIDQLRDILDKALKEYTIKEYGTIHVSFKTNSKLY